VLTLLWGLPTEEPLRRVQAELGRLGAPTVVLDQRRVEDIQVELSWPSMEGTLTTPDGAINLAGVGGCYLRPYDTRRLERIAAAGPQSGIWQHAMAVDAALLAFLDQVEARVVNRPSAMQANGSKPFQLELIARSGFSVPDTLVTTDIGAVDAFWSEHGQVVYKSVSGVRSRVARLTADHRARLADVGNCPTLFQEYVPGVDVRVHVVGGDAWACRVESRADDYRYPTDGEPPAIQPVELPPDVVERCRSMAADMDLVVAGIDLRVTPDGRWFCFEVNPSPAFSYYEARTAQPIAAAIARWLTARAA
jgi:glutathione synthase/RimK-type ligase-like ATP-grasp enzyme